MAVSKPFAVTGLVIKNLEKLKNSKDFYNQAKIPDYTLLC